MLHARGENHEEQFLGNAAISLVDQDAAGFIKTEEKVVEPAVIESRMGDIDEDADIGKDSGNESAEAESDSEDKKESMKEMKNALVGMNVSRNRLTFLSTSIEWFFSTIFHGHRVWLLSGHYQVAKNIILMIY